YMPALILATALMAFSPPKLSHRALFSALALFGVLMVRNIVADAYWYDYFMAALEVGACYLGVHIFAKAVPLVIKSRDRRYIEDTEIVCVFVLLALVVRFASNLPLILGMDISVMLAIFLLFVINIEGGVSTGAVMGVVFGFVTGGDGYGISSSMGAFAFASLCSSLMSRFGKWGIVLGFLAANTVMSAFFAGEAIPFDIFEITVSAIVFALVPKGAISYISSLPGKTVHTATKAFVQQDKMQNVISDRLNKLSASYTSLAQAYDRCFKNDTMSKSYIIHMLDTAASAICPDCGLKYNCWERSYKESYRAMLDMLSAAEEKGVLTESDVPSPIKDKCLRLTDFVQEFNRMYEVYKVEKIWQNKLNDSRMLVSKQLYGVGRSMERVASEFDMCLDIAAEKELKSSLDREKLSFKELTFLKGSTKDSFSVEILLDKWHVTKKDEAIAVSVIEKVTGQKTSLMGVNHNRDGAALVLGPCPNYSVSVGNASACRSGEKVSGDSYIVCRSMTGDFVAAISDGMGTGAEASVESVTATELLNSFISSGMDVETSLELINSSLLLRSSGDSFATMDVCVVNLMDGSISLIKSGAATGYVKSGDKISAVRSDSLPFGVLADYGSVNTEVFHAEKSSLVVMMSDGVSDVLDMYGEDYTAKKLKELKTDNPQLIASSLLNTALDLSGKKANDDMTVLVLAVRKS
ncbi:MAG: SpoIIE family protein phosphatase, partial [Clostridia bacterium]|nr:SpoIIE family protein phosphatase [Clostridia bacterium]